MSIGARRAHLPVQIPRRPAQPPRVAMVGAGQLARMTHQAAITLGVELRVLATGSEDAAVRAGAAHLLGSPASLEDLRDLADGADVLTFDHERIPPEHLEALEAEGVRTAPRAAAKHLAQDKHAARQALADGGFPVPPFARLYTRSDAERFAASHGWPLIGKLSRGGYDGRGVFELPDLAAAAKAVAGVSGILIEPRLELRRELALLLARSPTGEYVTYPVVETIQREAMCREIFVPADISPELARQARDHALAIAERFDVTGLLAVEFFETADGLLVNELALRPHNSGHWTIEGAATSQFEQHLRAVLGWPLGVPTQLAPAVVTVNVVGTEEGGDPRERIAKALAVPGAHIHLYGKTPRPGRKLGHVTVCGEDLAPTRQAARLAASLLEGASP